MPMRQSEEPPPFAFFVIFAACLFGPCGGCIANWILYFSRQRQRRKDLFDKKDGTVELQVPVTSSKQWIEEKTTTDSEGDTTTEPAHWQCSFSFTCTITGLDEVECPVYQSFHVFDPSSYPMIAFTEGDGTKTAMMPARYTRNDPEHCFLLLHLDQEFGPSNASKVVRWGVAWWQFALFLVPALMAIVFVMESDKTSGLNGPILQARWMDGIWAFNAWCVAVVIWVKFDPCGSCYRKCFRSGPKQSTSGSEPLLPASNKGAVGP